ncbi:MAG: threonine--tRNA ligase [Chloroflexi bacterium]|nr:threonine--tRNA ligase [Chloroflexota bacterium]|tara:strand:- start:16264 stop:18021 length:1758 start_codon:yes stop_codon:yes gene_type:complete
MPKDFNQLNFKEKQIYLDKLRHSSAHVLAEAVIKLFPKAKLTIGPPIEDGFYYDFDVQNAFTPKDLKKIEQEMRRIINQDTDFIEREVTRDEAMLSVKDNQFKIEILESIPKNEKITLCSHSNGNFEDLCRGGHVDKTGDIKALKLMSTSGAYWRGDEKNPMLQRIYGTAWESKESLDNYLNRRQEAKKRDHRKLGRDLDLFFFDDLSPASPYFLPKGTIILNELYKYVRELYEKYDYKEVVTPQIFDTELWKLSGHYSNYSENMYFVKQDEKEHGVKPMNCPAAAMLYKSKSHSYRDLPLRLADFGRLHRYERSGVTHGLTRVRTFTQDDAHIFCTVNQIGIEIKSFLDMLSESYKTFGFNEFRLALSTRPEKKVGDDKIWDNAESILKEVLDKFSSDFTIEDGEGAFYGPKIDVFVPDAIGREWQLGTIQLDFSLPDKFDLEYTSQDGTRTNCVVIHRAMLGSMERFLGVLIEHLSADFPLWLTPVQSIIIPITDKHNEYCNLINVKLKNAGIRSEIDKSNERMNAKIRQAQLKKIPYMIIIGDKELENQTISIRSRTQKNSDVISIIDFIINIKEEIKLRTL